MPIDLTFVGLGFGYSFGNVLLDRTLPMKDLDADIQSPLILAGHTMDLFGFTSQIYAALLYAWAQISAIYDGSNESQIRSGLEDMRVRISILFIGARPVQIKEFAKKTPNFVPGTSLIVYAPTGQYFSDKLINIGTNR